MSSLYGEDTYGGGLYGGPVVDGIIGIDEVAPPSFEIYEGMSRYGGVVYIGGELFLADHMNTIQDEVWGFYQGSVDIDVDQQVPGRANIQIGEIRKYTPYQTMFAPFLVVKYMNPKTRSMVSLRHQLGLFVMLPETRDYVSGSSMQTIEAFDMVWLLSQRFAFNSLTLAVGTNPITYIRSRMNALGFPRFNLTSTSKTLTKEYTWRPGTSWLQIFNDLLDAIGYYHIWADQTGVLTTWPIRELLQTESQTLFSTDYGDIGNHVRIEADPDQIRNDVMVFGNSPSGTAISVRRTNTDPTSPTSIYGLRTTDADEPVYLTLVEDNPAIDSVSAATARATQLLEERSSKLVRQQIEIVPYPGLNMREPIDLYIETDAGHVASNGKWWWDQMSVNFGRDIGAMSLRCNKLSPFETTTVTS